MPPSLRFKKSEIAAIAHRYAYAISETKLIARRLGVHKRGHLTKNDLRNVAHWKSPRSAYHARKNTEEYVAEVTRFAFATECERARITSLTLLDGVSWPTASVILHLFHSDPYPILDFRAVWSVSLEVPQPYSFGFWWPYVEFCRKVAKTARVDMRMLDRALWQYSKENQPP
ncbi:MAG: hypothetical protein KAS72_06810 [Phycisphaerales bacterium]|nr:hypothetical protein [Phycisphaerales bacterium]